MHLYNLSLQSPQALTHAIFGSFSDPKAHEIVLSHGKILELIRPDTQTGKIVSVLSQECFSSIRSLMSFRLPGGNRDYIVIGSDSGKISILDYDSQTNKFKKVHEETFGKSGCRRIVPGQYLARDPKGRALMIGAIEKQKLVYILNRDNEGKMVISSPLEAHKSQTLCLDMCGLDVEFENPMFACLEIDFADLEDSELSAEERVAQKIVTFYELDLGLNHVTRKHIEEVDPNSNLLISVPGSDDGPGGCLVCAENWVIYLNEDHDEVRAPIPRRTATPDEKGILITSYATHKQKNFFFFLLQSESGDLFKVTLDYEKGVVNDVRIKYFDTIPPTNSLCVLKIGFLFAASEFSNHYLFTFKSIGDDDDSAEASSQSEQYVYFDPRPLKNLILVDESQSLSPITALHVEDLMNEGAKQIYALCGRGSRSSLRILRHGLAVTEMAVSEIPGKPMAVQSVKKKRDDEFDSYIVVSFANATLVLSIGDTVEEVVDSGLLDSTNTVCVSVIGSDMLMQVHPNGIRLIHPDNRINEQKPPDNRQILKATTNGYQVAIAMSSGELAYFELDSYEQLVEVQRRDMGNEISCLAIAPVMEGRLKARFLVVGDYNNQLKVLDLESSDDMLRHLSTQKFAKSPQSCQLSLGTGDNLLLFAGLSNGTQVVSSLNALDGRISDARPRFLGKLPVNLFSLKVQGKPAVIALSDRSYLSYTYQGRFKTTPLSYETLEFAWQFCSEQCPEGIVAICGKTLRILSLERYGEVFNQTVTKLRYTPRSLVVDPISSRLVIAEADHNAYSQAELQQLLETLRIDDETSNTNTTDSHEDTIGDDFVGALQPMHSGRQGSCLRIFDVQRNETLHITELEDNEAAFSMCLMVFKARPNDLFVIVGTVQGLQLKPHKISHAFIRVYQFANKNSELKFMHKTEVNAPPLALCEFQGQLLAGVGNSLRLYDIGRKKLLRKSENRQFPSSIRTIHTKGPRIFVGDMNAGLFYLKYSKNDKQMIILADNVVPRYITATADIDFDTVATGDKFGNFCISRLNKSVAGAADDDMTSSEQALTRHYGDHLNSAAVKLEDIVQYYVGDVITSIQKTSFSLQGAEVIVYGTIMGSIGCFYPFRSREDVDFFMHLEAHMRQQSPSLTGRDHMAFRSYYFPVKGCIDGDLCEQFQLMDGKIQRHIADEMATEDSGAIMKRIETLRNHII